MSDFISFKDIHPPVKDHVIVDVVKRPANVVQRGRCDQFNWCRGDIVQYRVVDGDCVENAKPYITTENWVEKIAQSDELKKKEDRELSPYELYGVTYPIPKDVMDEILGSNKSDGSTASYYELPKDCTELQHLISYRDMNAQIGEIFRACYRYGIASHSDRLRDAKKIKFYAEAEIARLEKVNG